MCNILVITTPAAFAKIIKNAAQSLGLGYIYFSDSILTFLLVLLFILVLMQRERPPAALLYISVKIPYGLVKVQKKEAHHLHIKGQRYKIHCSPLAITGRKCTFPCSAAAAHRLKAITYLGNGLSVTKPKRTTRSKRKESNHQL